MRKNILTNTDSYKWGMWLQYPENTEIVYSYIESRSEVENELVMFGLQYYLKEYLSKPFTKKDLEHYVRLAKAHGDPVNEEGWNYILEKHDGKLPIIIKALPEGTVVNSKTVMAVIYNTDPKCYWLTTHIETSLLRAIWYPTTVASNSRNIKKVIKRQLEKTGGVLGLNWKLHDFGARGTQVFESAGIGGAAHLVNFYGSDTVTGSEFAIDYYNADYDVATSIPATEHSISTSYGINKEKEYVVNHIDQCLKRGFKIFACVADTYNIYNFIDMLGTDLKDKIVSLGKEGATLVVRPDSGDPTVVPVDVIRRLMQYFGFNYNEKGYKVLPSYIRVIQGDGIDINTILKIYENMETYKLSAENIAFGMGGKLLGAPQRDDFKFAMKASDVTIDSVRYAIAKDPITDKGKKSKKGRFAVYMEDGEWITTNEDNFKGLDSLIIFYENGEIKVDDNFSAIRKRAEL